MYSVQDLAKMYGCARRTIYTKLDNEELQPYLIKAEKGMKLMPEGLNILNVIMSESKVNKVEQEVNSEVYSEVDTIDTSKNAVQDSEDYKKMYVSELLSRNEDLRLQLHKVEQEKAEMQSRLNNMFDIMMNERQKLLEGEKPKKGLLQRWFS